ncbi:vWA domain-containing protein [Agitococcus lubricus]|uniref:Ca-activated chloride channel family protein n=1 Tax=Agitococcus lubricus TaxID=1077255 RepID=A0A2T5IWA1_9GAMM|nr:VWA domain-containing protein [Agitococcus lubricus]PTQ88165.1 Ca-activated chloride channel family protein [Agitococcus lubricus]
MKYPTFSLIGSLLLVSACSQKEIANTPAKPQSSPAPSVMAEQSMSAELMTGHSQATGSASASLGAMRHNMALAKIASPAVSMTDRALRHEERDKFSHFSDNPIKQVSLEPVSTFSLDVDTGSYALVRQYLRQGRLPPTDAVRTEELINYFTYEEIHHPSQHPFAVHTELTTAPWQPAHYLLRVGVQAQEQQRQELPPANLVFLVDVSGSMDDANKLPLVIRSLELLTEQLRAQDSVSLVVYAGRTEVVLEPTAGNRKAEIRAALARLQAGGSTAGASALNLAYQMARKAYKKDGINRILLATDGDFNVGVTDTQQIKDIVQRERESGVTLSTLGFGLGNFNDAMMEQIADVGNGNYSYIDSLTEARKVLVDELSSTFHTVAQDVKIQIEFNPQYVREYRLIGYENRQLKREDFNNDKVDAGDVGAGKRVTAIYEITPNGAPSSVDALRYQQALKKAAVSTPEFAFLKVRYKHPNKTQSVLWSQALVMPKTVTEFSQASVDHRFACAVAGFGQLLRQSTQMANFSYPQLLAIAQQASANDRFGLRSEFLQLVQNANSLTNPSHHE